MRYAWIIACDAALVSAGRTGAWSIRPTVSIHISWPRGVANLIPRPLSGHDNSRGRLSSRVILGLPTKVLAHEPTRIETAPTLSCHVTQERSRPQRRGFEVHRGTGGCLAFGSGQELSTTFEIICKGKRHHRNGGLSTRSLLRRDDIEGNTTSDLGTGEQTPVVRHIDRQRSSPRTSRVLGKVLRRRSGAQSWADATASKLSP